MERASVRTEANGPVITIILDRPDRRDAIDWPTSQALAAAFRAFERDAGARVAVLWGANGTFCAGADLKAVAAGPTDAASTMVMGRWAPPACGWGSR